MRIRFIFLLLAFLSVSAMLRAQERRLKNPARIPYKTDSTVIQSPRDQISREGLQMDTLAVAQDSVPPPKGDIETTINYTARDSIRASLDGKTIWLYGEAKITYGQIELEAEEVIIDYANSTITAQGIRDSLGNRVGYPIFKDGPQIYETKGIVYNFKTRRARIVEVVTEQGEGFLHSEAAFKTEDNEIFSIDNSYTTCNLEHPHYRIRATKTKAIPDDKIVAGPFYVEFNDIPLPAGFLFGMFPAKRESKSGILFPSYGEERRRGFNLRGLGYYFDISEYVKLGISGDIYSKGGHAVNINAPYMKRYAYQGSMNFSYSKNWLGDEIENRTAQNDFRLSWNHTPQSKGTGRFSASVNAATSTFNRFNNLMYGVPGELTNSFSNISARMNSNISYSKRFAGSPFSLGVNMSHAQNLQTRLVTLSLPSLSLNMTNIYPFQRPGRESALDNLSVGYSMSVVNQISNQLRIGPPEARRDSIAPFTFDNLPLFFQNARNGIRHNIPISHSFKALRYFTLSPSVNFTERWYLQRLDWRYIAETDAFVADTTRGFSRVSEYNFSASLNTRVYGMYFFKRGNVKAMRHVMNPSVSFAYTPDFSRNPNYFSVLTDKTGREVFRSRYEGFAQGATSLGRAAAIGFTLGNNVEMKVKTPKDTVERKVMLLNNLSFSTNYNLLADSFKLANVGISANTNILNNLLNINLSANLDPYTIGETVNAETGDVLERRVDRYAIANGRLGRITTATLALNSNLNPRGRQSQASTQEKIAGAEGIPEEQKQYMLQNANQYIDFDIPWNLNVGYTMTYSHPLNADPRFVQSLQFSGDLSISEAWKITFNSGYDFENKAFTTTNLSVARDIHCWSMFLTWVPFGPFQQYNFTIAVKASILRDLKLERRSPFLDNRGLR